MTLSRSAPATPAPTFHHRRRPDRPATDGTPLCVDLDGTLLRSDSLVESILLLARQDAWTLLRIPVWLTRGKAHLKEEVARRVVPDASQLPYDPALLDWISREHGTGRELALVTAANFRIAEAVADQLGLFERCLASSEAVNLSGPRKAAALVETFGERGFDYVGNAQSDLAVWAKARRGIVVGNETLATAAARVTQVDRTFVGRTPRFPAWWRALRPHQWLKNLLVFVPLLAAHQWGQVAALAHAVAAFLAFSLAASSGYLLNDLLDLPSDRDHPRKRQRPLAAGQIDIRHALLAAPALFGAALLLASSLTAEFLFLLVCYYLLSLIYSLRLKRVEMLDVLSLAMLYTVRIVAGAAAVSVALSFWLLAFSMFLFLSLAMVKRYAELLGSEAEGEALSGGRSYAPEDRVLLLPLGSAAGYLSVLVLALYINSPESQALYREPRAMWLLCPALLYWVSRMWMKAHRGLMHDDPLVFAMRDHATVSLLLFCFAAAWFAL